VDVARVVAVALERGAIGPDEAARLSHDDKLALIFRPGVSTAATVTQISGRGMGLDVAISAIERMRGRIRVATTRGAGAGFVLEIPPEA
jgi:two-component system chemotaxis sensor kinase CheA